MTETWPLGGRALPGRPPALRALAGAGRGARSETGPPARPGRGWHDRRDAVPAVPRRRRSCSATTPRIWSGAGRAAGCGLGHLPATTDLLGKRRLAVRHDDGWLLPRDVLEALEAIEDVPLPARCGFWAGSGGVAVEAVVRHTTPDVRSSIMLGLRGVPVRELRPGRAPQPPGAPDSRCAATYARPPSARSRRRARRV